MEYLPYPSNRNEIHRVLESIDERLLRCTERFIRQQVRRPILSLIQGSEKFYSLDDPRAEWFNIYSIYNANQQINESCNKLWATIELSNVTSREIWNVKYDPVGENFHSAFMLGTLIPTLYYSQISAIISILSSFGCIPIRVKDINYYLIRTEGGWMVFKRGNYVQQVLGLGAKSWHEIIIKTYEGLTKKGVKLPKIQIKKTKDLKNLRNEFHYEILGDLKMWRPFKNINVYSKYLPTVVKTIQLALENLSKIKTVTTNCDRRFQNLLEKFKKTSMYKH
ncbi:MAG: hypothetical protein QXS27_05145 [Candidatus Jordarchaeaceae archaeon]